MTTHQVGAGELGATSGCEGTLLLILLDLGGVLLVARGFGPLRPGDSLGVGVTRQWSIQLQPVILRPQPKDHVAGGHIVDDRDLARGHLILGCGLRACPEVSKG
jgi:hypothetical protein